MQQIAQQAGTQTDAGSRQPETFSTRLIITADRAIYSFSGCWLAVANWLAALYVSAIVLAPVLRAIGQDGLASPIYRVFGLFCHQEADRSFHIEGNPLACCERCAAVYFSLALSGVLFGLIRTRIRSIQLHEVALLISPLVIDGMAVGAGMYPGNVLVRAVTGLLFGIGAIWWLYPRVDAGFAATRANLEAMFDRLVAQGRAKPLLP